MNRRPADRTVYVSDLDRTLLRSDGSLSARSAALLNEVMAEGALITFATARSFSSSRKATMSLRLALPVLTYGGTIIADPDTGAPSDLRLLPADVIEHAVEASERRSDTQPILFTLENGRDWLRWDPRRITPGTAAFLERRAGDPRLRPITSDDPVDRGAVFYVTAVAPREALVDYRSSLEPVLGRTAQFLSEDPATPGLDWLEFHSPDGTKGAALSRLVAGLDVDRVVVFGDNHMDVPMFRVADEGYAVVNAVPELKAIATGVLGHHDSDAVAEWIAADWRFGRS